MKEVIALAVAFISGILGGGPDVPSPPAQTFSVPQAKAAFKAQTGLALVPFRAASTPEVQALRTRPYDTRRFGNFQLFVIRPGRVARMQRVFTHGGNPDPQGVYWVPDQTGGWIAVRLLQRNLILAWFPLYPSRETDARFDRLTDALHRVAIDVPVQRRA